MNLDIILKNIPWTRNETLWLERVGFNSAAGEKETGIANKFPIP